MEWMDVWMDRDPRSIPKYFTEDYFSYLEDPERPSFRWILVGPTRSGTHSTAQQV
jgi:hypothetical protein